MSDTNSAWIEQNLQRQRKMLEDKQKQKRHQSAGSVRTTTTTSSMSMNKLVWEGTMKDYPAFETSLPFSMSDHTSNMNTPLIPTPQAPPRNHTITTRQSSMPATETLIQINDYPENDISAKLSKVNLTPCVVSDDEDSDRRSYRESPWHNDIVADKIKTDILPDYNYIKNNLQKFVDEPAQEHCLYRCSITRHKSGVDKTMYPTYYLHLEEMDSDKKSKIFLLAARKRKKSTTANYLLSTDPTNLSREGDGYCAKVRSNALGTHFTIYDNGHNPKKTDNQFSIRQELAAVIYETNVLGFKGPRKMTVIMPGIEPGNDSKPAVRCIHRPVLEKHTLLEKNRSGDTNSLKVLTNKSPQWNDETQSYVLNFHGRVTQASVKNFQIIHPNSPEYIVMQFGRVSEDEFTMDFRYPLSAVQAFGIAMTSFHGKLACE
ncbi:hypothetical protein B9Z55_004649 [Caenorhabditis nigoni]|nr:hypothetical protein B9Z55_004649 [Caenorhabditis nigoni]